MPLGGPHKVCTACVWVCVWAGWFSSAANINTRLFMPAKIETLKCNAAIFGRTIWTAAQFAVRAVFAIFSISLSFLLFFFFCCIFFDWRSVCFAKSQTPWVVAEPLPVLRRTLRVARHGNARLPLDDERERVSCVAIARCKPPGKHWTCQCGNTVCKFATGQGHAGRRRRMNDSRVFRE